MQVGSKSEVVQRWLPKRIILVRHGECLGHKDEDYISPDHKTPLTPQGMEQARQAGRLIWELLKDDKVYIYASPYECSRSTLREMGRAFPKRKVIGVREECRVREQDFGNFRDARKLKELKDIRNKFGRFFYRFPEGESGADVYDRVSSFLESLWRDIDMKRFPHDPEGGDLNVMIVSHGLAIRIFLMRWFRWTVEQFEGLKNPKNGEYRVMRLSEGGEYSLAIHHDDDERLKAWGLTPTMIADQKLRARAGAADPLRDHFLSFDHFFYPCEDDD